MEAVNGRRGGRTRAAALSTSAEILHIWDSSTQSGAHFSCIPGATAACTPGLRTWTCEHLISPRAALGELELEVGRKEYVCLNITTAWGEAGRRAAGNTRARKMGLERSPQPDGPIVLSVCAEMGMAVWGLGDRC